MTSRFYIKSQIYSGENALSLLCDYENKRVGIVTDSFMVASGMVDKIIHYLPTCSVKVFGDVKPDPNIAILEQGTQFFWDFKPEILIALGGGSSLDAAKGVLVTLQNLLQENAIELIAIPTTSGSGSEVTSYAVISDPDNGMKYPLVSDDLVPDVAILAPELVLSVPKNISADTGMDVMTHAIEAYVSTNANDFSDAFAEKALCLIDQYLPKVFNNPNDLKAREKMHNASCMAGMAFNSAGLGLVHGMAHAIGGILHIPHGKINAMLLPIVIEFNAINNEKVAARYAHCAKLLGLNNHIISLSVKQLVQKINTMNQTMGIPATLKQFGIESHIIVAHREKMITAALSDGCTQTNPKHVTYQDIEQLLKKVTG